MRCVELLDWRQPLLFRRHSRTLFSASNRVKRGLVGDRAVEDSLEGLPLAIVEPEHPPVDQGILSGVDPCLKQKLRDVLV